MNPSVTFANYSACNALEFTKFIELSGDFFAVVDHAGMIHCTNAASQELLGCSPEEIAGRPFLDFITPARHSAHWHDFREFLRTAACHQFEAYCRAPDGTAQSVECHFTFTGNGDSMILLDCRRISDLHQERGCLEKANLSQELILESVSDGIFGVDESGRVIYVNSAALQILEYERDEVLRQTLHYILHHSYPDGSHYDEHDCPINLAIRAGISRHVSDEVFWSKSGKPIPVDYRCSPMIDRGSVVGAVVTFHDLTDQFRWRHSEQELQAAQVIQQKLYPRIPPEIPGYELYGTVVPASHACGDYYDFISLDEARYVFAVADVTGHGLGPALQMVETRAILRSLLERKTELRVAVELLNQHLFEDLTEGKFVSLFLAELNVRERQLRYVGAGHDALICRSNGFQEALPSTGLLLGLMPGLKYEERTVPLERPGDLLAMLTDGIVEALSPSGKLFGRKRMMRSLKSGQCKSCREIADQLLTRALTFSQYKKQDDMTMLLVKAL